MNPALLRAAARRAEQAAREAPLPPDARERMQRLVYRATEAMLHAAIASGDADKLARAVAAGKTALDVLPGSGAEQPAGAVIVEIVEHPSVTADGSAAPEPAANAGTSGAHAG